MATKQGEEHKRVKPATTTYFLRERTDRAVMDVQDSSSRVVVKAKSFGDAAPHSSLCFCLRLLFDKGEVCVLGGAARWTHRLCDRQIWIPRLAVIFILETLDAETPFRAIGSPDLCHPHFSGHTPFFFLNQLLFFCDRHMHKDTSIKGCDEGMVDCHRSE